MHRTALAVLFLLTTPAAAQTDIPLDFLAGDAAPAPMLQGTPTLKQSVTVTSEVVRIGDMIENAGAAASIAIFRAPDLGTAGTVSAEKVLHAARAHIAGIDAAGVSEVRVTRASRAIAPKDIEAVIAQAVAQQLGNAGDGEITARIDRDFRTLHVDAGITAPLQVTRLNFDARSGRFEAAVELPGSTLTSRQPMRFSGKAMETVEVATLTRPLNRTEVVHASDIVMERRPKAEIGSDAAGDARRVVGMAVRRAMRAGAVLRAADLMRPELVQRNESVTLIFEVPGIMLTSRAKALEPGAEGDTISVLNLQSKRTIQGTVTGPHTVTVFSMKPRIAAVASADRPASQVSRTE